MHRSRYGLLGAASALFAQVFRMADRAVETAGDAVLKERRHEGPGRFGLYAAHKNLDRSRNYSHTYSGSYRAKREAARLAADPSYKVRRT